MKLPLHTSEFELVVCGAGMSGIVAALQAARMGVKTALINDRGVLGGNAGPEVRIHICGANGTSEFNMYSDEGGILGELLTENRYRNPQGNVYLWHDILLDAVLLEENLTLFLNTYIDTVNMNNNSIESVEGTQSGSEKRHLIKGKVFVDDTGDGTIGYLSGAEFMYGREKRARWNESIAPEKEDEGVLLSSMSFYSKDFHRDMVYNQPEYSKDIKPQFEAALPTRVIPNRIPMDSRYDGFRFQWYYETGAGRHQTFDNELIRLDHAKLVSNIWNEIKNNSNFDAKQYDLEYISPVLGKRESRRIIGEYILKQQDVALQSDYDDCIGHGGWSIDLHSAGGFYSGELINIHYYLRGIYKLPFRICVARDVDNLMVASRCASFSHVALGTARVMGTLCMLGQASGVAAVLCKKHNVLPKDVADSYVDELKQLLQEKDQFVFEKKPVLKALAESKITAETTFNGCLKHTEDFKRLDKTIGVSLPIDENSDQVTFFIKAEKDTELKFSIHKPSKPENYGPEILVFSDKVVISKSDKPQPVLINLNINENLDKVFITIEKNEEILIELADDDINGYDMFSCSDNEDETYFDIVTLNTKKVLWTHENAIPVLEVNSNVYSVDNIKNGFIRNFAKPNLWLSADDKQQTVRIEFKEAIKISELSLTFDTISENLRYDNLETFYDSNVCKSTVKNYNLYIVLGDEKTPVASVRDNYKKVNRIKVDGLKATKVLIELLATNGSKRFALYDLDIK